MYQDIVQSRVEEHECFYCNEKYKYQLNLKRHRQYGGRLYQVTTANEPIAVYAYVDANTLEIDAVCQMCGNNNRFRINVE